MTPRPPIECAECRKLVVPADDEQRYCSRHCARTAQARRGIPSQEDRKAQFLDAMSAKFDEIFKDKR